MRHAARNVNGLASPCIDCLAASFEAEATIQYIERLVLMMVDMPRRSKTLGHAVLHDRKTFLVGILSEADIDASSGEPKSVGGCVLHEILSLSD